MYRRKDSEWIRHLDFEIIDILCLTLTYMFIELWRGTVRSAFFDYKNVYLYLIMCVVDLLVIFLTHPYKSIIQRGYWKEAAAIFKHFSLVDSFLIVILYSGHISSLLPRLTMGIHWIVSMLLAYGLHILFKVQIRKSLLKRNSKMLLLYTDIKHAIGTYNAVRKKMYTQYKVSAIVLTDLEGQTHTAVTKQLVARLIEEEPQLADVTFLYGKKEATEYLRQQVVDEVFLDRYDDWNNWDDTISDLLAMGLPVHIGLAGMDQTYPNSSIQHFGDRYVLTTTINQVKSWQLTVKRMVDIAGALVGLAITGICSIFIIPAIKIADPGPVLFSQIRISTNGRPFRFYKFRSMYMDAEARKAELMAQNQMQGFMFKMENDPRIIGSEKGPGKGLGNFLRSTSLDELPQFWNVLIGDMSLVGTRPPTQQEYEMYENRHKIRLSMKPGITGLWQVSGRSDITDFEEVVRLDTQYIENWSLGQDIKIILKTIKVVFAKVGSR